MGWEEGAADRPPTEAEFNRCCDVTEAPSATQGKKGILKTARANVQDVSGVGGGAPFLALSMQQPAGSWKAHSR